MLAALMRLSLLLRGKVPGGSTAVACQQSRANATAGTCRYHGHVVRDGGYLVLQYWFFHPMNDWRSSFGGVNDTRPTGSTSACSCPTMQRTLGAGAGVLRLLAAIYMGVQTVADAIVHRGSGQCRGSGE